MTTHRKITTNPLAYATSEADGFPLFREGERADWTPPAGVDYVPVLPAPEYDPATEKLTKRLTPEADGWEVIPLTVDEKAARIIPPSAEKKLATLNDAYKSAVPVELQAAFAPAFAIVRVLVQADEAEQAVAYLESLAVPPELTDAKAGIIALLNPPPAE